MRRANLDLGRARAWRFLASVGAAAGVLTLASCQLIGGFQPFEGGGGAASTGSAGGPVGGGGPGGSGGAPACEAEGTHTCMPKPPVGWSGPVLLHEVAFGADVPACVGDYGTSMGDFDEDLDEGTPSCSCACTVSGIVCNDSVMLCGKAMINLCNTAGSCSDLTLKPKVCTATSAITTGFVKTTNPAPTNPGTCDAAKLTKDIKPPKWASAARPCTGPEGVADGCSSADLCVPSVAAPDKLCIVASGSQTSCPDTFFSEFHALFTGFDDERDCSTCSCQGPPTSSCDGSVTFFDGVDECGPIADGMYPAGSCIARQSQGTPTHAKYDPDPSGTCASMGGELTGQVVKHGAIAVCCH